MPAPTRGAVVTTRRDTRVSPNVAVDHRGRTGRRLSTRATFAAAFVCKLGDRRLGVERRVRGHDRVLEARAAGSGRRGLLAAGRRAPRRRSSPPRARAASAASSTSAPREVLIRYAVGFIRRSSALADQAGGGGRGWGVQRHVVGVGEQLVEVVRELDAAAPARRQPRRVGEHVEAEAAGLRDERARDVRRSRRGRASAPRASAARAPARGPSSPPCVERENVTTRRAQASSSAMAWSETSSRQKSGTFVTRMPSSVAWSTGMLSTPTP